MFLCSREKVTNVLCVSLLSHDRYQYDSLILSKQTWAYPRQHLQQLLWCQGRWRDADITKECLKTNVHLSSTPLRKLCVHGFDNVESVYLFDSNPVYLTAVYCYKYSSAPVSAGNAFQDLPRLLETADNTERYI
jgi:hypothetical protein